MFECNSNIVFLKGRTHIKLFCIFEILEVIVLFDQINDSRTRANS